VKELNEEENFDLPMTPMIDIVFQMLIFFLLATTIQEEERDLQINLPPGAQGSKQGAAAGTRLSIGVRKDGAYTLGGAVLEFNELRKRLTDAARSKDKPQVSLRGDRQAPYEKIAQVLQLCNETGIDKVNVDFRFVGSQ